MWIIVIFISVINILFAFIINDKNARYFLAGYNTMSEEERKSFDIVKFIKALKTIFLITGIFTLLLYGFLYFNSLSEYSIFVVFIIPVLTLPFILYYSGKYKKNNYFSNTPKILFFGVLGFLFYVLPIILVITVLIGGLSENAIELLNGKLIIHGKDGQEVKYENIVDIALIDTIPSISKKIHGFDFSRYRKGYFKTTNNKTIKLYVELRKPPYINIVTIRENIFWNYSDAKVDSVYNKLKKKMN